MPAEHWGVVLYLPVLLTPNKFNARPDFKICWFAVTRVCFFEFNRPVGIFYHFETEKIALIFMYLNWFSSSSLRSTSCVYWFYNVHAIIMNLAYFNPHSSNPRNWQANSSKEPRRLSLLRSSLWIGWWFNHSLEGYIDSNFNETLIFS